MVKIIDGFMFYNELKMLDFRLHELSDVVDYFILVEAKYTFSGKEKPLFYNENKGNFLKFQDKIIHIIVEDMPNTANAWDNENYQRMCIDRGIKQLKLKPEDIIIISDCDEIPNPFTLSSYRDKLSNSTLYKLEMELYYYNLICKNISMWYGAKLLNYNTYCQIKDPQKLRKNETTHTIRNGGWHFSYFGDVEFIKNKIKNSAHQEYNNETYLNNEKIQNVINNCDDLFFRGKNRMTKCNIENNTNLPKYYEMLL